MHDCFYGRIFFSPAGLYGNYRSVRNPDWSKGAGNMSVMYEGSKPSYDDSTWKAMPVKKGT